MIQQFLRTSFIYECCVFRPAFGCLQHPKAGRNIFFSRFSTFFVHFRAFSVISRLKSTKNEQKKCKFVYSSKLVALKSTEKRQFRGTPSRSRPAFACRPALRSRQFYIFFRSFFVDFSREITKKGLKSTKKNKKGRKTAEKNVSTSFRVLQAPESWSKYTTLV